jgi:NADPH:quinone reductase-like Zn-dependent oxidoreductase
MKEVIIAATAAANVTALVHDAPIPVPNEDEILIKVVVAASNVKGLVPLHPVLSHRPL